MISAINSFTSAETHPVTKFALFGALHLTILALTIAIPAVLSIWTRHSDRARIKHILAAVIAAILVLDRIVILSLTLHDGRIIHWAEALPMHLCDWAMIVAVVALLRGSQLTYELAYFWGLSGTAQAILTPDLAEAFPSPAFISFFVSHCGIVVSVLFMTWGMRKRPLPGSIWRAVLWSQVYLVCAGLVDWLTGTNFGYLAAKPGHASLLDAFAPWPWYILELELASVLFYAIFYFPFWIADRRRQRLHPQSAAPARPQ